MPLKIKKFLLLALPFGVSALLLSVIQAPVDWSFFAWVAMAPFVLACAPRVRARSLFLAAYGVAFFYWLVNLYWLAPITVLGWIAMCFYIGLLWPLLALTIRFCRRRNVPLFVALPILIVGVERLQGFPLGGFYWRLLGHSQYSHITLIQIADIFGAGGVSFLVAMVNGLLADLVLFTGGREPCRVGLAPPIRSALRSMVGQAPPYEFATARAPSGKVIAVGVVVMIVAVVATIGYGRWRIGQTDEFAGEGPRVAALQSNVPQSVKGSHEKSQDIFDELMASNIAAQAAGAELVVWPETMVQAIIEPALWPYLSPAPDQDKAFHQALRENAKGKAYLLIGAHGAEIMRDFQDERYLGEYNSAYLYRPDGTLDPHRYDKIHLVLFGEYIPFRRKFNWLYQQLKRFAPEEYNYDYSLEHGTHYTLFEMTTPVHTPEPNTAEAPVPDTGPGSTYHFGVIICYEDAIPYVARNFALDENSRKRVDWLVNISNDGWFVNYGDGWLAKYLPKGPSTELPQHAAVCTFRAVENRLSILRSVNTGISCLIDSVGRIHDGYLASSKDFPSKAMQRTGMAGWFLDKMPIDRRVTFYSRHGQWLDTICAAVFVALLALPVVARVAGRGTSGPDRKPSR